MSGRRGRILTPEPAPPIPVMGTPDPVLVLLSRIDKKLGALTQITATAANQIMAQQMLTVLAMVRAGRTDPDMLAPEAQAICDAMHKGSAAEQTEIGDRFGPEMQVALDVWTQLSNMIEQAQAVHLTKLVEAQKQKAAEDA